jgi:multiple sugar transport system permease protein
MATGTPGNIQPAAIPAARRFRGRRRSSGHEGYKREEVLMGYLFVLIPMAIFLTFFLGAMGFDFWISFNHWAILDTPRWVGWGNYNYIFHTDPVFWTAIKNTIKYALIVVPLQTVIAFLLALVVNQNIRGKTFFRTTFYFPSVTSSVAISLIFVFIFNNFGLLNTLLGDVHIQGANWLGDPSYALESIMGLNIWTTTGTLMIIFLASLQDVPREVLEAAALDGATGFQSVIRIIVPLIRPAMFFVVANGIIGSLQIFDQAFIVSQGSGGPEYSTMTAVLYIYNNAFANGYYGVAAAASFVLFAFIFVVTILVRKFIGEEAS